jgi:hypothetical protein
LLVARPRTARSIALQGVGTWRRRKSVVARPRRPEGLYYELVEGQLLLQAREMSREIT